MLNFTTAVLKLSYDFAWFFIASYDFELIDYPPTYTYHTCNIFVNPFKTILNFEFQHLQHIIKNIWCQMFLITFWKILFQCKINKTGRKTSHHSRTCRYMYAWNFWIRCLSSKSLQLLDYCSQDFLTHYYFYSNKTISVIFSLFSHILQK